MLEEPIEGSESLVKYMKLRSQAKVLELTHTLEA